jgi:hypothetical protein
MSRQFSTRMKMKQPLQYSRTPGDEKLKRIEISFAKQDFKQRISLLVIPALLISGCAHYPANAPVLSANLESGYRFQEMARTNSDDLLLINNACAARGGAARMTLTFAHGLRFRRRWFSLSRRLKTSAGEHRGPTPTCE